MKKHSNISITIWTLLLCIFTSCNTSEDLPKEEVKLQPNELILNVSSTDLLSRATVEGIDNLNENLIKSLDCFLYATNSTEDTQALYRFSISQLDLQGKSNQPIKVYISQQKIDKIFGSTANTCKIYAIANRPTSTSINVNQTSIKELKSLVITSNFASETKQTSFVMDGVSTITLDRSSDHLTGSVNLERAASKISLTITALNDVIENVNGEKIIWTPQETSIQASLLYGVNKSHVNTDAVPYIASGKDFFHKEHVKYEKKTLTEGGIESSEFEPKMPFYSYSRTWKENEETEPYILLVIAWQKSTDKNRFYNCYYQIPINTQGNELRRNNYYKIKLQINALGSFIDTKPTSIHANYSIVNWSTNTINTYLNDLRYLMVDHTYLNVYNHKSVRIQFASSHKVVIDPASLSCTHTDLSKNKPVEVPVEPGAALDKYDLRIDEQTNEIVYSKNLDNEFESPTFDFTPYTLRFRVQHEDNAKYHEYITLIQYPAIYAIPECNSDWNENADGTPGAGYNDNHGYVFVNGYYSTKNNNNTYTHHIYKNQDFFCSAEGFGNINGGPNMYVLTVTSVQNTPYRIGDPREKTVNQAFINETHTDDYNDTYPIWCNAYYLKEDGTVSTNQRRLTHYYGTDNSSDTKFVIAPKFRIASAYSVLDTGVSESQKLEYLKKRCASYQEDGYPAGRWRLPTQAEFEFIISQVDKNKLPQLYIKNTAYWCAHGIGIPQGNGKIKMKYSDSYSYSNNWGTYGASTRCVYDEWYWIDKIPDTEKGKFVWGDRERK